MITMHPGEYLKTVYLDTLQISQSDLAECLGISPSSISRVLSGKSEISPEMAVRLSFVFDLSAECWMEMQNQHSLRLAKNMVKRNDIKSLLINGIPFTPSMLTEM